MQRRLCIGKHKGRSKLGLKCSSRNLNINSALLCWYNFLVVTAFFMFCLVDSLNPVQVFKVFFIVSLVVWAWLQIASVQRQHFLFGRPCIHALLKVKTLWTMSLIFSVALLDWGSLLMFNCTALLESSECFFSVVLLGFRFAAHVQMHRIVGIFRVHSVWGLMYGLTMPLCHCDKCTDSVHICFQLAWLDKMKSYSQWASRRHFSQCATPLSWAYFKKGIPAFAAGVRPGGGEEGGSGGEAVWQWPLQGWQVCSCQKKVQESSSVCPASGTGLFVFIAGSLWWLSLPWARTILQCYCGLKT